ncbi:MAG: adenosylcobinamide-GDP ribazoletransferase [Deltaproteobacteria bacterium]|nr:adenosylcobinamide-GDP ribazoletransferase [Deltaproteobacteria bacterium]
MLRGFVSAVRTLSLLPVPGKDADNMTSSLPWFPVVGALLGTVLFGLWFLLDAAGLSSWPEGEAFVLVVASVVLTRGLHLDGLADWADGFFSMTGKERTLEIMKDSRIGTFGVLSLIIVIGLKWVAIVRLIDSNLVLWIIAAYVISRTIQVELAVSLPYARAKGGTGAPFVNGAHGWHRVVGWILAATLLAALGPYVPCILIPGYIATKILGYLFKRRLGGVTGDLLGASSEMVETLFLALFASLGTHLSVFTGWESVPW